MNFKQNAVSAAINVGCTLVLAALWAAGVSWLVWILGILMVGTVFGVGELFKKIPAAVNGKFPMVQPKDESMEGFVFSLTKNTTRESVMFDHVAFLICAVLLFWFVTGNGIFLALQLVTLFLAYNNGERLGTVIDVITANGGLENSFAVPTNAGSEIDPEVEPSSDVAVPTESEEVPAVLNVPAEAVEPAPEVITEVADAVDAASVVEPTETETKGK